MSGIGILISTNNFYNAIYRRRRYFRTHLYATYSRTILNDFRLFLDTYVEETIINADGAA